MNAPPDRASLEELRARADRDRTVDSWLDYTRVLAGSGQVLEAVRTLRQLWAVPDPALLDARQAAGRAAFLQNTGVYAEALELDAYATYCITLALAAATQATGGDDVAYSARAALARQRQQRDRAEADQALHALQLDAMTEWVEAGRGGAEHHRRLAELTLKAGPRDRWGSRLDATTAVLNEAARRWPTDVSVLEDLASVLSTTAGAEERLDATLLAIERLDPASAALQNISGCDDPDALNRAAAEVATFLLEVVRVGPAAEADAALADLRNWLVKRPRSTPLRNILARGLMHTGQTAEARHEIDLLIDAAARSHAAHYNLAITLLEAGDTDAAARHAELARTYATDEADMRDADTLIGRLASR